MIINQSLRLKNNGLRKLFFKDQIFKENSLLVQKAFQRYKIEPRIIELTHLDLENNGYQSVKLSTIQIFLVGKIISHQMNGSLWSAMEEKLMFLNITLLPKMLTWRKQMSIGKSYTMSVESITTMIDLVYSTAIQSKRKL